MQQQRVAIEDLKGIISREVDMRYALEKLAE